MVTPMRRPARLQHRADNPPAHAARPSPGCSHVGRPRPSMCTNGEKRLLQACEQVPVRTRSAFSGQLHGRYGLGVAARATPTPDTCRRSRDGSRARRGAAELSLIYADRRRVVQAVPASPGVRSPLEQFLERLLVLAQLLGCCRRMTSGRSGFPIPCAWKIARTLYISEKPPACTYRISCASSALPAASKPPPQPTATSPEHLNFLAAGYSCRKPTLPRPGAGHIDQISMQPLPSFDEPPAVRIGGDARIIWVEGQNHGAQRRR
jgi:hypothetical protein